MGSARPLFRKGPGASRVSRLSSNVFFFFFLLFVPIGPSSVAHPQPGLLGAAPPVGKNGRCPRAGGLRRRKPSCPEQPPSRSPLDTLHAFPTNTLQSGFSPAGPWWSPGPRFPFGHLGDRGRPRPRFELDGAYIFPALFIRARVEYPFIGPSCFLTLAGGLSPARGIIRANRPR